MASSSLNMLPWKWNPETESEATMASTSGNASPWKYDVFLSFRGADTRRGFISHLENALRQNQIGLFIDNQLRGGENISPALLEKIEESYISVVVFSQNYADSPWCLDELVKICDCKKRLKQTVLPVFYQVDPTDVQELRGSFGAALVKHSWRDALTEIANLKGYDYLKFESDAKLVEEIVSDIWKILRNTSSHDFPGLVGIEPRIKEVVSLMCIGSSERCIVGIWGMGGIGKTTIAEAVYHRVSTQFEGNCFVRAVREKTLGRNDSVDVLIKNILSRVLGREDLNIETHITPDSVTNMLRKKKFLVVLDDVNRSHLPLIEAAQRYGFLSPESRIILTSRDKQILENGGAKLYKVKELDHHDALQLFKSHAFKQNCPSTGHEVLLERVAQYCKGHPLAIRVLGSNLYNKSVEEWESELEKIEQSCDNEIQKILRISYDALDQNEKNIFLDIACVFYMHERNRVESILDTCGFYAKSGLRRLIDKSLITVPEYNTVEMHDLLRQLGEDIVCKECIKEPGNRSRLWNYKDICHVLTKKKGTEIIEVIWCKGFRPKLGMDLSPTAFKKMFNLRLLNVNNFNLPKGLKFLPNSLVVLDWYGYPCKSLPSNFCPENLFELQMVNSCLEQLWDEVQPNLMKLKYLSLRGSSDLIRILNFQAPNLEIIDLLRCESLVEIPSSIGCTNLTDLILDGCTNLIGVPSFIGYCTNLTQLGLSGCEKLIRLPRSISNLKSLKRLCLAGCKRLQCLPKLPLGIRWIDASQCISLNSVESLFTEVEDEDYGGTTKFIFKDCVNLDGSTIMEDALKMVCKGGARQIEVVIPGTQVPEWFAQKSGSCSLTVKYMNCNYEILVWAFCAVFTPIKGSCAHISFDLEVEPLGDGPRYDARALYDSCFHDSCFQIPFVTNVKHVVLRTIKLTSIRSPYITKACFEGYDCKLIECGARPVFAQCVDENEGPAYSLSSLIAEAEDGNEEAEEVEPHPKRLKLETKELISLLPNQAEEDGINQEEECNHVQDWLSL